MNSADANALVSGLNYYNVNVPVQDRIVTVEDLVAYFDENEMVDGEIKFNSPNMEIENIYVYLESYDRAMEVICFIKLTDDSAWRVDTEEIYRVGKEREALEMKNSVKNFFKIIAVIILFLGLIYLAFVFFKPGVSTQPRRVSHSSNAASLVSALNTYNANVPVRERIFTEEEIKTRIKENGTIVFVYSDPRTNETETIIVAYESYNRAMEVIGFIKWDDENASWSIDSLAIANREEAGRRR